MSFTSNTGSAKITVPDILQRKSQAAGSPTNQKKIACLTAYDYPTARLLDEAGVDVILVGDSLGMVVLGYDSTLPVTIDEMLHHTRAVRRGAHRALVVADMPYGSYHTDMAESLRNAMRFIKDAGAEAVKVEGGERRLELIARFSEAEIPVMAHVGLTPQSVNALGGYHVQGKTPVGAEQLLRDARAVEAAGAFAIVLEAIPRELGGADHQRGAHPHDRHRRGPGLRRADPGVERYVGLNVWADAKIFTPVRQRGRNNFGRGS